MSAIIELKKFIETTDDLNLKTKDMLVKKIIKLVDEEQRELKHFDRVEGNQILIKSKI